MTDPLASAFVGAYAPWVTGRLAGRGLERSPGLTAALEEGRAWLEAELEALLALPFAEQRRAPLEVFQEAMRFPTSSLEEAGEEPAARDPALVAALPGDLFDLAPASSQALGEDVWHAHLAWGAAKARAMAPRRAVAYVGRNLMDRAAIEDAASARGLDVLVAGSAADVAAVLDERPLAVYVDLAAADADDAVRAAAAGGVRVIGFGPHVDDVALVRARSLGADQALPRSRFFRILEDLLPDLA